MVNWFYSGFAVACMIVVSVCGARHRTTDTVNKTVNNATVESSLNIPRWLRSVVASVKRQVPYNIQEDTGVGYIKRQQDNTFKTADDSLPVLIHKTDNESSITITPSSLSDVEKVNPFFRTKRSTCTTPANLTAMVRDLNRQLTSSQLIKLNPGDSPAPIAPANEPSSCPTSITDSWWPRPEVNLRSTCPWTFQQVDLGVNAFPRYVNNAICMCTQSCIGSPSMRCMEVTYDVTYFLRKGCQDGLAVMETKNYTVNIGCHCVGALPQVTVPNYNSE